ncbi:glycosyltransferase family 39 protein, partial [Candidatus Woesebacteria bacterium]|nr:glycosyltransferase family 39 protein [Candidatus Woesebacteria bacterium]
MSKPISSSTQNTAATEHHSFRKLLLGIVLVAALVRCYKLNAPLADWHSFRQADTASVTREYVKHGIDLFHPRYHDLSNIQSGILTGGVDNLEGYRMVEFPFVNGGIAAFLRLFPNFDLVIVSRLFSIAASLIALIALATLGKQLFSARVGLLSAGVFALLPFSVFYGRAILPEPFLISFLTVSLLFFDRYQQNKITSNILVSMGCFSLALLLKPMAIFFLPAYLGIVLVRKNWKAVFDLRTIALGIVSLIPLFLWRQWITQFPTGIPWSSWLYNLDGIRLRPAWWRWLFWERLTKLWLGLSGLAFFGAGLIPTSLNMKKMGASGVLCLWGIGMGIYLVVFATGNVRHDYYQVILLPFVSLVVGKGIDWFLSWKNKKVGLLFVMLATVFGMYFSWNQVKGYYSINHWEIVEAGKAADRVLPLDAKVIAPYNGDTAFLFQTNRTGWPIGFDLDKKIANGATHYVTVNF